MQRKHVLGLVVMIFGACSLPLAAQETTSPEGTDLFSCKLNDGANSVRVELWGDDTNLTYSYANERGQLELNIEATIQTVDYAPFAWDSDNLTERVTFYNGDTTYEVFSTRIDVGDTVGGVIVTSPSGDKSEIHCDAHWVKPGFPSIGLGRLAVVQDPSYSHFDQCLSSTQNPTACLHLQSMICLFTSESPGDSDLSCLQDEYAVWESVLADALANAEQISKARGFDLAPLEQAQTAWIASRDADCNIADWTIYNVFDGEKGKVSCLSHYTAERVSFLKGYIGGVEFDG